MQFIFVCYISTVIDDVGKGTFSLHILILMSKPKTERN